MLSPALRRTLGPPCRRGNARSTLSTVAGDAAPQGRRGLGCKPSLYAGLLACIIEKTWPPSSPPPTEPAKTPRTAPLTRQPTPAQPRSYAPPPRGSAPRWRPPGRAPGYRSRRQDREPAPAAPPVVGFQRTRWTSSRVRKRGLVVESGGRCGRNEAGCENTAGSRPVMTTCSPRVEQRWLTRVRPASAAATPRTRRRLFRRGPWRR